MKEILINIIFGDKLNENMDNIENFYSSIIPPIGSTIFTKKFGKNKVKDILINYRNIQYENEDERGGETIFVFI